jgi:hypothetical protein
MCLKRHLARTRSGRPLARRAERMKGQASKQFANYTTPITHAEAEGRTRGTRRACTLDSLQVRPVEHVPVVRPPQRVQNSRRRRTIGS